MMPLRNIKLVTKAAFLIFVVAVVGSCAEFTNLVTPIQNIVTPQDPLYYPPIEQKNRIRFLTTINSSKHLNKPYGIAFFNNKLFVVDSRAPAYLIMNTSGNVEKVVTGKGKSRLLKPINISIDRQGNRYVTDTLKNLVFKFDKNDKYLGSIGLRRNFKPVDAKAVGNELYISDLKSHKIHIFNKRNGRLLRSFSRPGSKNGELFFPTNISFDIDGQILVSDTGNNRLQLYNKAGYLVRKYGDAGNGLGQFSRPKGVAIDHNGRVYAIDSAFENIQLFDPGGSLLLVFGKSGIGRGELTLPADIAISYKGIENFQKYTDEKFKIIYLIFVTSQFGPNKINVYGFGHYRKG